MSNGTNTPMPPGVQTTTASPTAATPSSPGYDPYLRELDLIRNEYRDFKKEIKEDYTSKLEFNSLGGRVEDLEKFKKGFNNKLIVGGGAIIVLLAGLVVTLSIYIGKPLLDKLQQIEMPKTEKAKTAPEQYEIAPSPASTPDH